MSIDPRDPGKTVSNIIERRNESRKWCKKNLWDELTTVWQAIKCRTSPIYKRDSAGRETREEDRSRTNVAMPDLNIIYRRNAARMTAQPYRLRYEGGDPLVAEMLSALSMQQYARSNEPQNDVRLCLATEAFGYGYTKLYWDKLSKTMVFRQMIVKNGMVVLRDRRSIMRAQGAPQDEIDGAVRELGNEMEDDELSKFIGKSGNVLTVPKELKKYEGPIVKWIFNGNLFLEPDCLTLDASDYVIEQYRESDLWLEKQAETLTYQDPVTGKEVKAFDGDAVNELLAMEPDIDIRPDELADLFKTAVGRQDEQQYRLPKNLRVRRKYDLLEQHAQDDEDGRMWITWISEKFRDKPLGRMPYPWDLYGKYVYSENVPLPDLLSSYGDSTPRLLRHLYAMHNLTVAQNFDYVTNLLKPFILRRAGMEVSPEVIVRGLFRELGVSDLNGVKPLQEPPLPNGAFEREAQILRMMSIAEPSLTSTDAGTEANPMAGKTATTAMLAAKASDALTQFKFDGRNSYLREIGRKKLWMNQQAAEDEWKIERKYWAQELGQMVESFSAEETEQWALTDRNQKTVAIRLDPMEIQEDHEVEPEAGSYLAVDDEMRAAAAQRMSQAAALAPGVLDPRKMMRFFLSTIRGIGNPDDFFLPPMPPQPPIKGNVNINIPIDKMPADIVNQLLPLVGVQPSQELAANDTAKGVVQMSQMGDAVDNLTSPTSPAQQSMERQQQVASSEQQHRQKVSSSAQEHEQQMEQLVTKAGLDTAGMKAPALPGSRSNGSGA